MSDQVLFIVVVSSLQIVFFFFLRSVIGLYHIWSSRKNKKTREKKELIDPDSHCHGYIPPANQTQEIIVIL